MAKTLQFLLSSFLLYASILLQQTLATKIIVTNNSTTTPGGIRFDREIGVAFTIATEQSINQFIWKLFRQNTPADRKDVPVLNVVVKRLDDDTLAETGGDNIYVNDNGIMSFGDARFDFTALMYHETTHIFQWSGRGTAPGGLTEGIADYVVMKSKYFVSEGYTKPGEGGRWDEGYGVTARFLEYCDGLREGFTVDLNNKMREVYKDEYFLEMLGKPLDQVWNEYKAKYAK
ncbi:hypothetical protein SASPL_134225 [Salvia splendens]|uniref:Plant basic secretory protein (BSP) family protein n=1 Tax=Salvia splendens TaxID=180675 RepID=A0A8X8ZJV4_SALSN|nr:uncharacterized protein LOC121757861 [Salvia splendens]KAG6406619.1 hypothetical protein SASPL_134225 [Salvia splendens]